MDHSSFSTRHPVLGLAAVHTQPHFELQVSLMKLSVSLVVKRSYSNVHSPLHPLCASPTPCLVLYGPYQVSLYFFLVLTLEALLINPSVSIQVYVCRSTSNVRRLLRHHDAASAHRIPWNMNVRWGTAVRTESQGEGSV
jgi:hypothetical protein